MLIEGMPRTANSFIVFGGCTLYGWSRRAAIAGVVPVLLIIGSCSKRVAERASEARSSRSALEICRAFEAQGVASQCRAASEHSAGSGWEQAAESALFDLPSVPGHQGEVAVFTSPEAYKKTVDAFAEGAEQAGPHRYGAPKALVFTQINKALPCIGRRESEGRASQLGW